MNQTVKYSQNISSHPAGEPMNTKPTLLLYTHSKKDSINDSHDSNNHHTSKLSMKQLYNKLRNQYNITQLNNESSTLSDSTKLLTYQSIILLCNQSPLNKKYSAALQQYIIHGGNLMLCLNTNDIESNILSTYNTLINQFGVQINDTTTVINHIYHTVDTNHMYYSPKQAVIRDGILCNTLNATSHNESNDDTLIPHTSSNSLIYSHGCTLDIVTPSKQQELGVRVVPFVSTGTLAYPTNKSIITHTSNLGTPGSLIVCGTHLLFDDTVFIDDNNKNNHINICINIIQHLYNINQQYDIQSTLSPDHAIYQPGYTHLHDTGKLSNELRYCIQDNDDINLNELHTLFDHKLHYYTTDTIPEAVKLYNELHVPHELLTLIIPEFTVPLPELQPAVYDPSLIELDGPELELYDLDTEYAATDIRLNQLTNKCTLDHDVDYYIREASEICGISQQIRNNMNNTTSATTTTTNSTAPIGSNQILSFMLHQLIQWKQSDAGQPHYNNKLEYGDEEKNSQPQDTLTFD